MRFPCVSAKQQAHLIIVKLLGNRIPVSVSKGQTELKNSKVKTLPRREEGATTCGQCYKTFLGKIDAAIGVTSAKTYVNSGVTSKNVHGYWC
jgi:hypothetical protein